MAKSHKEDRVLRSQFCPKEASNGAEYSASHIRLPAVYASIRSESLRWVSFRLSSMFDRADDVFFEKAQKLYSNQEQEAYFAAMREMRLIRKSAEKEVFENLSMHFANLANPDSSMHNLKMEVVDSFESLSLMERDELEENVAFDAMILRARSEHSEQFACLVAGLNAILSHVDVSLETLPLAPKHICDAFRRTITHLDCAIECKLILYKLFEKEVLSHCSQLLVKCNAILSGAGVATKVERQQRVNTGPSKEKTDRPVKEQKEESPIATSKGGTGSEEKKLVRDDQSLVSLLTQGRYCTTTGTYLESVDHSEPLEPTALNETSTKVKTIPIEGLIGSLSRLQSDQSSQSEYPEKSDSLTRLPVESMIVQRHQRTQPGEDQYGISSIDSEAINFVTMIFDFILNDINISPSVKTLLSRLQIPMIKVAILDRSFFTSSIHPARKLLNDMGRAGISLSEQKGTMKTDVVYTRISHIVQTILEKFESNIDVFSEQCEEFSIFLQAEEKRTKLLEKRILAAEKGKAASEHAKLTAISVVEQSIAGKQIPVAVKNILEEYWVKVLSFSYLQSGKDGRDFEKKCEIVKHIVRSVIPPRSRVEKEFIESMTPMLCKRLTEGLDYIGIDEFDSKNIVNQLKAAQDKSIAVFTNGKHSIHMRSTNVDKSAHTTSNNPALAEPPIQPGLRDVLEEAAQALAAKEVKPTGPEKVVPVTIRVGAWVNVASDGEKTFEPPLRCKLAAHIKISDRLIFVDRRGGKVLELCSVQLEQSISKKQLAVVDQGLVFERALESIVDGLRTTQTIHLAAQH